MIKHVYYIILIALFVGYDLDFCSLFFYLFEHKMFIFIVLIDCISKFLSMLRFRVMALEICHER